MTLQTFGGGRRTQRPASGPRLRLGECEPGLASQPGPLTSTSQPAPKTLLARIPRGSREEQQHFTLGLITHALDS